MLNLRRPMGLLLWACTSACAPRARVMPPVEGASPSPALETGPVTSERTPQPASQPALVAPTPAEDHPLAEPSAGEPPSYPLPRLASFYRSLHRLNQPDAEKHVRVMWMGDSHTAADFMTDQVRRALFAAYPKGGPGFVRLGMDGYRHSGVRLNVSGKFSRQPKLPAQRTRVLDGVFGYGGIRLIPRSGASASVQVSGKYSGRLRFTLSYRLQDGDGLVVQLGNRTLSLLSSDPWPIPKVEPAEANPMVDSEAAEEQQKSESEQDLVAVPAATMTGDRSSGMRYVTLEGTADDEFVVRHLSGQPEIFGAFIETLEPGVVVDTVGINGARVATALAWQPAQFVEAAKARGIDLLILSYGSNEIFDRTDPEKYVGQIEQLVSELRQAVPDLPCWIVGPPDASTDDGRSRIRVAQVSDAQRTAAEKSGCAFTSAYDLMGGERSFARWTAQRPPLARTDHVHLTILGYEILGQLLAESLLGQREGASEVAAEPLSMWQPPVAERVAYFRF